MASSSTATRKSQWSSFQRFCDGHSLVSLPCTEHTVCLFIAELSQRHLEYNTVVNYIHSITSLHHRHDHLGPDLQHFSIREALAGLQRSRRELPYQKQAITLHHLHCIHRELRGLPRGRRAVFWAACLTAFNSLLRSANLFPQPAQPDKAIRRMDVTRTALGLELTIRVLKTNRFSGEELKIPLHRLPIQNYLPRSSNRKTSSSRLPATFSSLQPHGERKDPPSISASVCLGPPVLFGIEQGIRLLLHTFLPQRWHNLCYRQWCRHQCCESTRKLAQRLLQPVRRQQASPEKHLHGHCRSVRCGSTKVIMALSSVLLHPPSWSLGSGLTSPHSLAA